VSSTEPSSPSSGTPAVGNILGFALLLSSRKALLSLRDRRLAPGVRVDRYEAEIPDVSFPMEAPPSVSIYRHRRCRAEFVSLVVERRKLEQWLTTRLAGTRVAGFSIRSVRFDPRGRPVRDLEGGPCLYLEGTGPDGTFAWMLVALQATPRERVIDLRPHRLWLMGALDVDPALLWARLAGRLRPELEPDPEGETLVIDPAARALTRPFVSSGWKAHDLANLVVSSISSDRRAVSVELHAGAELAGPVPAAAPREEDDPVGELLAKLRATCALGADRSNLHEELERLDALVAHDPMTHLASLMWRADLTRFTEPERCLEAVREWLTLAPADARARRMLATLLALDGKSVELASLLAASCRLRHPPREQARLELALATLLLEKLDDATGAVALLDPLIDRIRTDTDLDDLLLPTLACLAQALARSGGARPRAALEALDEALALTRDTLRRASMRASVARAFAAAGDPARGLHLMTKACSDTPDDEQLIEEAIALGLEAGETEATIELLRLRMGRADATQAAELRRRLVDLLCALDQPQFQAMALAELRIAVSERPDDAELLRLAADLEQRTGNPIDAAAHLQRLSESEPDDVRRIRLQIERARLLHGQDPAQAIDLLRAELLSHPQQAEVVDLLIELLEQEAPADEEDRRSHTQELADLYSRALEARAEDAAVLLRLAQLHMDLDDLEAAASLRERACAVMPEDDPRSLEPALHIARYKVHRERWADARQPLERVLALEPDREEALQLFDEVARRLDDPALTLDATSRLIPHASNTSERAALELRQAESLRDLGQRDAAIAAVREAAAHADPASALHIEIAERWLEVATQSADDSAPSPNEEADARAELRTAWRGGLSSEELRQEALLLGDRLERHDDAIAVIEEGLSQRPTDELLLTTLGELPASAGRDEFWLAALTRACTELTAGELRDRLAVDLAVATTERDDPQSTLEALEWLSPGRAQDEALLDLRFRAVRALGVETEEIDRIERALISNPTDDVLIGRLHRLLPEGCVDHLLALTERVPSKEAAALAESAFEIAKGEVDECRSMIRALGAMVRHGPSPRLPDAWAYVSSVALEVENDDTVVELLQLAQEIPVDDLDARAERLFELALLRMPSSTKLHKTLLQRLEPEHEDLDIRVAAARDQLEGIAGRHGITGEMLAAVFLGLAGVVDRRHAADLLVDRAQAHIGDRVAFDLLVDTLKERDHWPEVIRALMTRVDETRGTEEKVEGLKLLANVYAEALGDPGAAIEHLERALELAPTDPDLLLPLIEHYYGQTDLSRAIELTGRTMEHVGMGDAAYLALAHRAVDACVASSELELARDFLDRATERAPEDARTRDRIAELEALERDPEHRVKLLAIIADRRTDSARLEALEERARLLLDPLGRPDEAIETLRIVLSEASDRTEARQLLGDLYAEHRRWSELVVLLEDDSLRLHGRQRGIVLQRIAAIYRDHLYDLPRAEHALWLALESAARDADDPELHDTLRGELITCMEQQGRYADLVLYLEREIEALETAEDGTPSAATDLMVILARTRREHLEDEVGAARVYERLQLAGNLPEEGLAPLARWYRSEGRHEDLVRVLERRAAALEDAGDTARRAEIEQHIGELKEGPLRKPHEAADHYLNAYLVDPEGNATAGARARVLLAGTDSVVNVRKRLLDRLPTLPHSHRPALLTLLGDLLAPHDDHEREAESSYRQALTLAPDMGPAHEGLGRLLARQARLDAAVDPLVKAARSEMIPAARAAENAAIAARTLFELDRTDEAEQVLKHALARDPRSQRALLELARLYDKTERPEHEAEILDELSELRLSSMLRAEVAYRRAMLLKADFGADPMSAGAEVARAHLLAAVSADASHAAARQVLHELAKVREEWGVVAHMRYLAIRELSPGPQRALVHVDLAETYLDHIGDVESALRNLESALQQGSEDILVTNRAAQLADRLPEPAAAAARFAQSAAGEGELESVARARLLLVAARLFLRADDIESATEAWQQVIELPDAPDDARLAARQEIEGLMSDGERDLRRQKSGLLQLLDDEDQPLERLHMLGRLREIGRALGDEELLARATDQQLSLAKKMLETHEGRPAAMAALRDLLAEREEYGQIVEIFTECAARTEDRLEAASMLIDAARFSWRGLGDAKAAVAILRRALARTPAIQTALSLLGEIAESSEDAELEATIYRELSQVEDRPAALSLRLAEFAERLGKHDAALAMLKEVADSDAASDLRFQALSQMDTLLSGDARARERLPVLVAYHQASHSEAPERTSEIALELATLQHDIEGVDQAAETCAAAIERDSTHRGLAHLHAELLEQKREWGALAQALVLLANLSVEPSEQALWLTRASRVHLDHIDESDDPAESMATARRLLERAREVEPEGDGPPLGLLPLAFTEQRWQEVLDLAAVLRSRKGDDHEVLILAALAEAYVHGRWPIAQAIGARHKATALELYLWPGLGRLLSHVASNGPLPRLDALLAAASVLVGGAEPLQTGFVAWATRQLPTAGICLGQARLREAHGDGEAARHLFELVAFQAPGGPVPQLVARLPQAPAPPDPILARSWIPLEGRTAVHGVLILMRSALGGIRGVGGRIGPPTTEKGKKCMAAAESIVAPWRELLKLGLPVVHSPDALTGGVGLRNDLEPAIVVGEKALDLPPSEFVFRLALAAASIANGMAILGDTHPAALTDLLDALLQLASPAHQPTGAAATAIADALAARGAAAGALKPALREALATEVLFWLSSAKTVEQVGTILKRASLLFATRLSGRLDGALLTVGRDQGLVDRDGLVDAKALLRTDLARWLLRSLGM
jgi:tetratricopeptide (TPR) repeat protein